MKNNFLNKNSGHYKNKNKHLLVFAFWALLFSVFFSMYYNDISVTSIQGKNFWHVLLEGNIRNYYIHEINNPPATWTGMIYSFSLYAVFALWDFPLFLLEKFMGINFLEIPILCAYSKMIVLVFLCGCAILIFKIMQQFQINLKYASLCVFLFITNICVLYPCLVIGQYDVIWVFFALLAIYKHENNIQFILWFALAISMKYFAIFIFIPLLLLKEKNVLKIIVKTFISCSLSLVEALYFPKTPEIISLTRSFVERLFACKIVGNISWFFLVFICLCIYCFLKNYTNGGQLIYIALVSMISLAVFCQPFYPYWVILFAPFLCMCVFLCDKTRIIYAVILETIISASITLCNILTYTWCDDTDSINRSILAQLLGQYKGDAYGPGLLFRALLRNNESLIWFSQSLLINIFVAAAVMFLVLVGNNKLQLQNESFADKDIKTVMIVRTTINFIICYMPIFVYFYCLYFK